MHLPSWPVIPPEGIEAVTRVLSSGKINYWTGEECRLFEAEYATSVGCAYGLAVANGTLAIELALRACGVGAGDEVIVPSRTFFATAGAVVAAGATPIVADIDPFTNCMTALSVARVLTPRTKAIIPVHLGGYPAPMDEIMELAEQVGAYVIEDCAQAHGALFGGRPVGSIGHMGCFSFCQDKIIPLGEGGLIVTNDTALYERAWAYRDHGRSFKKAHAATVGAASSQFKWMTDSFGTNARLGEMEGALGRVFLRLLPEYHAQRAANVASLADALQGIPAIQPIVPFQSRVDAGDVHAGYRLYALVDTDRLGQGWTRDRIIEELNTRGVPVQYGACALIGNEEAFKRFDGLNLVHDELVGAHIAHNQSIAFYVHPTLTQEHMAQFAEIIAAVMDEAVV